MNATDGTPMPHAGSRPLDPATGKPLPAREQPGYYPGFSTLSQQKFWDAATREKVLERVHKIPPIRFFTPEEARLMEAIAAHVLPQDDRMPSRRIPDRSADRRAAAQRPHPRLPLRQNAAGWRCVSARLSSHRTDGAAILRPRVPWSFPGASRMSS